MDWLFRRHFWVVHLVFLALCASILALTVNALINYSIAKTVIEQPASLSPSVRLVNKLEDRDFSIINERNLFDARREVVTAIEAQIEGEGEAGNWQEAVLSSSRLRLVGTIVFLDPHYSLAAIEDLRQGSRSVSISYSINECQETKEKIDPLFLEILGPSVLAPLVPCNKLADIGTIKRIEEKRVYFFNEQEKRYEYLAMEEGISLPPTIVPPPRALNVPHAKTEYGKSVKKTGANSYEIDASDLDSALENLSEIAMQARAVPVFENGKSIGFKLVNILPDSVFEKIGLKNGDIVTHINGYELNSPDKGLELYQKLKTNGQFSISTKRGEFNYSILGRH